LAAIGRASARSSVSYRFNLALSVVTPLAQVYLMRVIWQAVYGNRASVNGITLHDQIAYSSLIVLQVWLVSPWTLSDIAVKIRDGTIAFDLLRPLKFIPQTFVAQVGSAASQLPAVVVALPFAIVIGGAATPRSTVAFLEYILASVIGFVIAMQLSLVVSMIAFWTLETQGINLTFRMVQQFFSGAFVPLWFMPDWLNSVAGALPFQALGYTPLAIYLGQMRGGDATWSMVKGLVWVAVLWVILKLIWTRALRRVVVQGG
jgi:ABC-2 type transport system permease protein